MNDTPDNIIDDDLTETDSLIARVAANEADGVEWGRFETIAASEPRAWEEMARTLRTELQARQALDDATAPAEHIDLPMNSASAVLRVRAFGWPGWALAAVLALAWAWMGFFENARGPSNQAGIGSQFMPVRNDADQAYEDYLSLGAREGRVLQELPMMMVETRFDDTHGTVEVVYVRQLLERATVQSAFELREDESGQLEALPVGVELLQSKKPL